MPTYGPLGTTVSLYTWETGAGEESSGQGESGQTRRVEVERVREDKFNKQGLDFLGPSSVPFFLVNAGQDLFSPASASSSDSDTVTPIDSATKTKRANTTPPQVNAIPAATLLLLESPPTIDLMESDQDTTLSSLNSSLFEPSPRAKEESSSDEAAEDGGAGPGPVNPDNNYSRPTKNSNKPQSSFKPLGLGNKAMSKPITRPKPLKLQIDLSNKSFMPSLITNLPEDICFSVFYNGEFMYSKVFRWSTYNSGQKSESGHPTVSGRRIGTSVEVPWVIKPMSQNEPSSHVSPSVSTAETTWGKISQSLLAEADEWGREGKFDMFRNPVGEYLEYLSKLPIPKKASPLRAPGLNIGVMDVIIGLGRSINHPYKHLQEPQRKLSQGLCGSHNQLFVVPKELSSTRFRQMIATFQIEDNQKKSTQAPRSAQRPGIRRQATDLRAPRELHPSTSQGSSSRSYTQGSRSATIMASMGDSDLTRVENEARSLSTGHDGSIERGQPSSQILALNVPTEVSHFRVPNGFRASAAVNASSVLRKPINQTPLSKSKLPKSIPQKRYRGPTPPPAEAEACDSVYIEPPSHSTRSRTSLGSASSPDAVSPSTPVLRGGQGPVDRTPSLPTQEHRAKARRFTGSATLVSKGNPFGLDGLDDGYYEIRHESMSFSLLSGPPLRQLGSAETNQAFRDINFGLDGTGDAPKSSKRKRDSLEATNSGAVPKSKVPRTNPRGRNTSGGQSQSYAADTKTTGSDMEAVAPVENDGASRLNLPLNQKHGGNTAARKPRQRNPLSARELDSLLEPHKPSVDPDTSFGHSFTDKGFPSRPTRNSTRQKVLAELSPTAQPRVTAAIKDEKILVIKGLRPNELPIKDENMRSYKAAEADSSNLHSMSATPSTEGAVVNISTESILVSDSASRVLRTTKPMGTGAGDIEHESRLNIQLPIDTTIISTSKSKKDNSRLSPTIAAGVRSTLAESESSKSLQEMITGTTGALSSPSAGNTIVVESLYNQELLPKNVEVLDKIVLPSIRHSQELATRQAAEGSKDTEPLRKEVSAASQARTPADTLSISKVQKPSIKMLPVMKFKTSDSTGSHVEPQTPSKKQAKDKPGLTIQPGLANAYRTYSESSTGFKTPTPRSAPLALAQFPDPPRTRASTRALQDSHDSSAIMMPSMIEFTPQKNMTPGNRILNDMSSSPTISSPSQETSNFLHQEYPFDSPTSSRALRSSKKSSTSIVSDLTQSSKQRHLKSESKQPWKPSSICQESVLSYVDETNSEGLPGLMYDKSTGKMCRSTRLEREGIFRTSGILMGVRYVFGLGSETTKSI
ncbi:hypothetical protein VTL71DRAFT_12555 [Oculimacula yallundae]|uniref:Uncharacterized protein n=1 Tax=Oculimacula yallundae TaxID=86028 RepID=A0ABR4CND9_9HELO